MSDMERARLYFVTDPICAWCWGMLPEVERLQEVFSKELEFVLCCAGLQVGRGKLTSDNINMLRELWQRVSETTGQRFSHALPDSNSFIYHSEMPCRLLAWARIRTGAEPWALFHAMQEAFYVKAQDLNSLEVLANLAHGQGLLGPARVQELARDLASQNIKDATRAEFEWCKDKVPHSSLPTLLLDVGEGPALLCGGYATTEFLIPDIASRLKIPPKDQR